MGDRYRRMLRQKLRNRQRTVTVRRHAQGQRFDSTQKQKSLLGRKVATHLAQTGLADGAHQGLCASDEATGRVAVATQIFGHGVHDQINSML